MARALETFDESIDDERRPRSEKQIAWETPCDACRYFTHSICQRPETQNDSAGPQSRLLKKQSLNAKDIIFSQGDETEELYRIQSGWALAYRSNASGGRFVLGLYLPGDVIDVDALGTGVIGATFFALTDLVLCAYDRRTMLAELGSNTGTQGQVATLWREKALRLERGVMLLQRSTAAERVASLVMELQARLGVAPGAEFELPLRAEEFSRLIGLTASHLSRTLAELRKKGILDFSNGRVSVQNHQRLSRVAGALGRVRT